jgi:4-amino-4-deoxy-L-arabinose transferase-like glycosyltransferase
LNQPNFFPVLLKYRYILLFCLGSILAFSFQGTRGLYDSTETRYAECAREMIETGNFLEPQLAYKPHWTKPPLIYWVIAGGMEVFGENEWGARIPNAVCFCILVLLTMGIAETLGHSEKIGFLSGLIMATSPLALGGSFNLSADLLLTVFETLAVFGFVKAITSDSRRYWITLMWVAFGLAFLTKGPVGLLPIIPIFIYQKIQKSKVSLFYWPGFLLFILVGLSWYIAVELRHPGLLSRLAYEEIFLRNTTNKFNRNPQWYKLFTVVLLPLFAGIGLWSQYYFKLLKNINFKLIIPSLKKSFLLLWLFIPLIPFLLSKSKLPLYILPLLVPLVISLAIYIEKNEGIEKGFRKILNFGVISAIFLFVAKGVFSYIPHKNNVKPFSNLIYNQKAEYYAIDDNDFFGPLFYLNGNLKNIDSSGSPQVLRDLKDKTVLFLVKKDKKELIEKQIREGNLPFTTENFKDWMVFIIGKSPS